MLYTNKYQRIWFYNNKDNLNKMIITYNKFPPFWEFDDYNYILYIKI